MPYLWSREHLDTLNRLWHLDHVGTLPLAVEHPAPIERASTSAEQRAVTDLVPALPINPWSGPAWIYHALGDSTVARLHDGAPCTCAKCQR